MDILKDESTTDLTPGLQNFGPEIGAELGRLGRQGATELAAALFSGSAFTVYGPNQTTPTPEYGVETSTPEQSELAPSQEAPEQGEATQEAQQPELEQGGREM